jgi:hypothetical protein
MMLDEIARQAVSLGISGLLFVMWWFERQERTRNVAGVQQALQHTHQISAVNEQLLDVIRANTDALAALREELRTHRRLETDWLNRVSRQLEKLDE